MIATERKSSMQAIIIQLISSPHANWIKLQVTLRKHRGISIIGEAHQHDEAVSIATAEQPDLIFAGSDLPGVPIVPLVEELRAASPASRIVVVGKLLESIDHIQLAAVGAPSFLLWKDVSEGTLRSIVDALLGGLLVMSQAAMERQMMPERRRGPRARDIALTDEERSVLKGLGAGLAPGEIADELHVSESTVKRILATLRAKFGVCSTNALCMQAGHLGF